MKIKLVILVIFSIGISTIVPSQNYYQIADTLKCWRTMGCGCGVLMVIGGCDTRTNRFYGDTIINSKSYLKVHETLDSLQQNWYIPGYIYEDTNSNQVYYRNLDNEEGLIYDFNLSVNDIVEVYNLYMFFPFSIPYKCYQIDSVLIGNDFRKRFFMSYLGNLVPEPDDIWIEGIGSINGVLTSGYSESGWCGGFFELLCYYENDSLIYMASPFNTCFLNNFYPDILSETYDTAYIGTDYFFQVLISDTTQNDSINWIDEVMPQGFWMDTINGIIHGNPQTLGSYRCIVILKNWGYRIDMLDANIVVSYPLKVESLDNMNYQIFPNPTEGLLFIENLSSESIYIEIINIMGKKLIEKIVETNIILDLYQYPRGIYCLKTRNLKGLSSSSKIIVKK